MSHSLRENITGPTPYCLSSIESFKGVLEDIIKY